MTLVCIFIICSIALQGQVREISKSTEESEQTAVLRPVTEVSLDYPGYSRTDYVDVKTSNNSGSDYTYRIFNQKAGYDNYSNYLSAHGCSTCALTSILRNIEGLEELTPDACLEIQRKAAGDDLFNSNFSKTPKKQMPITQYGARKVFDSQGVYYELPESDPAKREQQITDWLRSGDPVYFTFGNGKEGNLSGGTHTVLLLGIDEDGYVVIGDSLHKSAVHWGTQGLVKAGRLTVADMLSYINSDGLWSVLDDDSDDIHFFYRDPSDRGYLLVRIDDPVE